MAFSISKAWKKFRDEAPPEAKETALGLLIISVTGLGLGIWHYVTTINWLNLETNRLLAKDYEKKAQQNLASKEAELLFNSLPSRLSATASDFATESAENPAPNDEFLLSQYMARLGVSTTEKNNFTYTKEELAQADEFLKALNVDPATLELLGPEARIKLVQETQQKLLQTTEVARLNNLPNNPEDWSASDIREYLRNSGYNTEQLKKISDEDLKREFTAVYNQFKASQTSK